MDRTTIRAENSKFRGVIGGTVKFRRKSEAIDLTPIQFLEQYEKNCECVLKVIVKVQEKLSRRVISGSVSLEHSSTVSKIPTCQHCARNDVSTVVVEECIGREWSLQKVVIMS